MCVGTEDGAQEVVKEILEDVVASAVKGEDTASGLSSSHSFTQVLSQGH